VEEEGSDPENDPPTSPEAVVVALLSGGMEVAEGGAAARERYVPAAREWSGRRSRRAE
jgi:hypothetical protein